LLAPTPAGARWGLSTVSGVPGLSTLLAGVVVAALALAGCGGGGAPRSSTGDTQAPAGDFPAAGSSQLARLTQVQGGSRPDLRPSVSVLAPGANRFGFGLFEPSGRQLQAPVAVYVASPAGTAVRGPFTARRESLAVQPRFQSRTTAQDPDAAKSVYVARVPFSAKGRYVAFAVARTSGGLVASSAAPVLVGGPGPIPVGTRAPRIHTPTVASVHGDVSRIDTRVPPDDMHSVDFASVVGRRPVVLTFATPQLCQSRVCGPVVDEVEQLKSQLGNRAAFIHMEIYRNNRLQDGVRPQVSAFGLHNEPWVFAIDRHGRVAARIEGAASVAEIRQAIERALR
jgi:hypothetical protein